MSILQRPESIPALENPIKTEPEKKAGLAAASTPDNVVDIVTKLGKNRNDIDPTQLGRMAAASLLSLYRAAKAETALRWVPTPRLLLNALYETVEIGAPLAALGAGVALDVAIFGGAARDLMKVNPFFDALAVGSLVFAVGIAISKHKKQSKGALLGFMLAASAGASLLAADDPAFIKHFSGILPASMSQTENLAAGDASAAKAKMAYWQQVINDDTKQLNTGGRNGMPILGDGFTGNDAQGHALEQQVRDAQRELAQAATDAARAANQSGVAAQQSPALFWGKIIGAGYLWAWLAASQIVIANVIEGLEGRLSSEAERDVGRREKRAAWKALRKSDAEVEAQTNLILGDFQGKLAEAMENDPAKAEKFQSLFTGASLEHMQQTAGSVFRGSVPRRIGFWRSLRNLLPHRDGVPANQDFRMAGKVFAAPAAVQESVRPAQNAAPAPVPQNLPKVA